MLELIYYLRSDQQGSKISQYEISQTNDPDGLKNILKSAYGIRNTVVKTRHLYMVGRTRIHFDRVDKLGEFIELEVVLSDSDRLIDGEKEPTIIRPKSTFNNFVLTKKELRDGVLPEAR